MRLSAKRVKLSLAVLVTCAGGAGALYWLAQEELRGSAEQLHEDATSFQGGPPNRLESEDGHARLLPPIVHMRESLPPNGRIPVAAKEFGRWVHDEDFVIGVVVGQDARAYPVSALHEPAHEVLNDALGGKPIGVTWCSLCQSPIIFDRTLDGKTLTICVSGGLAGRNMVLKDVETGSEWVQILGEAVSGPLKGKRLEVVPALWTDWKTWLAKYPKTTLAALPHRVRFYHHVAQYSDSPEERAYFDRFQWGLADDDKARSWPFSLLASHPIVNDRFEGRAILVCFDQHSSTVAAFDRSVEGQELTFHKEGASVVDGETGSSWDPVTGRCTEGVLSNRQLHPAAGIVCTDRAWSSFYPDTEVWDPSTAAESGWDGAER